MRGAHRRGTTIAAALLLLSTVAVQQALAWDTNPLAPAVTSQHHLCGAADLPEGDIQGHVPKADQDSRRAEQGYNCGLALVGHLTLDQDGRPNQNANMAWAGHCAYIGGFAGVSVAPESKPNPPPGAGVAVVSVATDGTPTYVTTLRNPGALATAETLNAVTTPDGRSILVVGQYGNDVISGPKPMDVYDVSDPDCSKIRHIPNVDDPSDASKPTYEWPTNIHNLTISPDGTYVFATLPLQAIDISGLWDDDPATAITYLGNIQQAMDGPPVAMGPTADVDDALPPEVRALTHPQNVSHEAWTSPGFATDHTLYVGGQTPEFELFSILDLSQWLDRNADGTPKGKPVVISQESARGHSIRSATIGGKPYLLHSEESVFGGAYSCVPQEAAPFAGPAQPWLTDISDPVHPRPVAQIGLEINDPSKCADQLGAKENDSVHYHDVDNPLDTTFVMASMWNAGIRVFDVRDPANPTEVAYFNPGDIDPSPATKLDHAWGHIRYVPETGQIWFATADGGFWVVRIERPVRRYLGLGASTRSMPSADADDPGAPGILGVELPAPLSLSVDLTPSYCTLAAMGVGR